MPRKQALEKLESLADMLEAMSNSTKRLAYMTHRYQMAQCPKG